MNNISVAHKKPISFVTHKKPKTKHAGALTTSDFVLIV